MLIINNAHKGEIQEVNVPSKVSTRTSAMNIFRLNYNNLSCILTTRSWIMCYEWYTHFLVFGQVISEKWHMTWSYCRERLFLKHTHYVYYWKAHKWAKNCTQWLFGCIQSSFLKRTKTHYQRGFGCLIPCCVRQWQKRDSISEGTDRQHKKCMILC